MSQGMNRPVFLALGALVALAASSTSALADDLSAEGVATRRQLIEEAQSARGAGDDAKALDLASRAGALQMSVSLRRFIAEEQLAVGRSAAALGSAELCVREAKADPRGAEHGVACEGVLATARTRVAFVVLRVRPANAAIHVKVAGQDVPNALLGERYVVDPGETTIDAAAEGFYPLQRKVTTASGDVTSVKLELVPRPPSKDAQKRGGFTLSPLVPVGASVAVAGGLVALGVGVSGKVALDDYKGRCTVSSAPSTCGAEQRSLQSDLDRRAIAVDVALGVAAAGLVAGTVGLLLPHPTKQQKAAMWEGKILF